MRDLTNFVTPCNWKFSGDSSVLYHMEIKRRKITNSPFILNYGNLYRILNEKFKTPA